jgi:hypothetical protein
VLECRWLPAARPGGPAKTHAGIIARKAP